MTRLILFAVPMFLMGCGGGTDCPEGTYPTDAGGCAELGDDDDGGTNGNNTGGNNTGGNNTGGTNTGGTNTGGNNGAGIGDPCQYDEDCAGNFCVVENGGDAWGICTESCSSWADCSEAFWECCDINNAGSACIPDDWVDRAGIQCN